MTIRIPKALIVSMMMALSTMYVLFAMPSVVSAASPMTITSNAELAAAATSGSGTAGDPWIIENLDIDASTGNGISITGTTDHFIIRNVSIHDGGTNYYGISLNQVTNGTIIGANFTDDNAGMSLQSCSQVNISWVNTSGSIYSGMLLMSCQYLSIQFSNLSGCFYNSLYVSSCTGITIANNTLNCTSITGNELYLDSSWNMIIENNTFDSLGITFWGYNVGHYNTHEMSANTVQGLPLIYMKNGTGYSIDATSVGQVIVASYADVSISNLTMDGVAMPIVVAYSSNVNIADCILSNGYSGVLIQGSSTVQILRGQSSGYYYGAYVWGTGTFQVLDSNMHDCQYGLYTSNMGPDLLFQDNTLAHNTEFGIYLSGAWSGATVDDNLFQDNKVGLQLWSSYYVKVNNNIFQSDGISIGGTPLAQFNTHEIPASNTVNGKPVLYIKNSTGGVVAGSSMGQLILVNSSNYMINNVDIDDAAVGILLAYVNMTMVRYCDLVDNADGLTIFRSELMMVLDSTMVSNYYGARISESNNISISDCNLSSNTGAGAYMSLCENFSIVNCVISYNIGGYGLFMSQITYLEIMNSNFSGQTNGVFLSWGNGLWVTGNEFFNNNYGMQIQTVSNIFISENIFTTSNWRALYLWQVTDLVAYHNNFISSSWSHVYIGGASANMEWNDIYPSGGNYWDDYGGVDANSGPLQDIPGADGIGDTAYNVYNPPFYDYYPLMQALVFNEPPIANFSTTPMAGNLSTVFSVNASLSSDLEDSLAQLNVSWDWESNGTWTAWTTVKTATHTYEAPGDYTIKLRVRDMDGAVSTKSITVTVSEVAPVTSITTIGTSGLNGWLVSNALVNLSATDDFSGINQTKYRIDAGSWLNYTTNITFTSEGTFTLEYFSSDLAGNNETVKSTTVKIDKTAPGLTLNQTSGLEVATTYLVVSWSGSDAVSGIDHFAVSIDGGAAISVGTAMNYNFTGLEVGMHNVTVTAVDAAGHMTNQTLQFTVTSESGGGISGDLLPYIGIIIAVVVAIVAIAVAMSRKKKGPPAKLEEMQAEPPAPPSD